MTVCNINFIDIRKILVYLQWKRAKEEIIKVRLFFDVIQFSRINIFFVQWFNDVVLVSLLLSLNIFHTFSRIFIAEFEQVNVCWGKGSNCGEIHAICAIYRLLFHILGIMTWSILDTVL